MKLSYYNKKRKWRVRGDSSLITALANAIASGLTVDELGFVAGIFVQLSDTLATIAARESLYSDKKEG